MTDTQPLMLQVDKGTCYALFAYDIGRSVDLNDAERRITSRTERSRIKHKRRAPSYFDYSPAPLRVSSEADSFPIGPFHTSPGVDVLVYDFGAISVTFTIPVEGALSHLLALSQALYENEALIAESRRRVEDLLATIPESVEQPHIADAVEDYVIFQIEATAPACDGHAVLTTHAQHIAQLLRSETQLLAEQEVMDSTAQSISYGPDDITIIDWNASLIVGRDMDDVQAVLEFVNVELLEMRFLDAQLDRALDQAYEALSTRGRPGWILPGRFQTNARRIGRLQVDSAILFERVTNTLKLFGDQYLARLHRLASQRFHLESWDASITRKLETLESIYSKMTDSAATRRMEILEWIIIALIAISIVVSFLPGPGTS